MTADKACLYRALNVSNEKSCLSSKIGQSGSCCKDAALREEGGAETIWTVYVTEPR